MMKLWYILMNEKERKGNLNTKDEKGASQRWKLLLLF